MKDEINLMSPGTKRARVRWLYGKRLRYLARRIVFVWLALLGVLAGSFWHITQRQRAVISQLAERQVDEGRLTQQVQEINNVLALVRARAEEHPAWTPMIDDILRLTPASVRLEVLALPVGGPGLLVRGISASRAAVVEMQAGLEKLPGIQRVEAPLQNFAAGGNNEFSFTLVRGSDEDKAEQ